MGGKNKPMFHLNFYLIIQITYKPNATNKMVFLGTELGGPIFR